MSYDPPRPAGRLLLTPEDKEAPARTRRLARWAWANTRTRPSTPTRTSVAELTGTPYAMVNFIDENRQFFAGLHLPRRLRAS